MSKQRRRLKKEGHTPFLIRNVPNDVYDAAKQSAEAAGIPLTKWVIRAMRDRAGGVTDGKE